jgi:hypothetical protein
MNQNCCRPFYPRLLLLAVADGHMHQLVNAKVVTDMHVLDPTWHQLILACLANTK